MKIGNPGTQVLALKNLTHSNWKNPGFKPRLGTWMPSLMTLLEPLNELSFLNEFYTLSQNHIFDRIFFTLFQTSNNVRTLLKP